MKIRMSQDKRDILVEQNYKQPFASSMAKDGKFLLAEAVTAFRVVTGGDEFFDNSEAEMLPVDAVQGRRPYSSMIDEKGES